MRHQAALRKVSIDRATARDLRALFSLIASASAQLEGEQGAGRLTLLLNAIRHAAREGTQLAGDMLRQGSPEAIQPVELTGWLRSREAMLRSIAGPDLRLQLDCCVGCTDVPIQSGALHAALIELVANARRASAPGGRILVRIRRAGARAWLTVADEGSGLPAEADRPDRTPAVAERGRGLACVSELVDHLGGGVRLRSRAGRGTVVCLLLPMVAQRPVARPPAGKLSTPRSPAGPRRHITPPKEMHHEERRSAAA